MDAREDHLSLTSIPVFLVLATALTAVFLAVVVGLAVALAEEDGTLAIVVGFLAFVATYLLMISIVAGAVARSLWQRVSAVRTIGDILAGRPTLALSLERIASAYREVRATGDGFLIRQAETTIKGAGEAVEQLAQGRLLVPGPKFYELALELIESAAAGADVVATSYVETSEWWNTNKGREYLQRNIEAVQKRRLRMTRIFIFDDEAAVERFSELLSSQAQAGIEVCVVLREDVETDARVDFMLVDDEYAVQLFLDQERKPIGVSVERTPGSVAKLQDLAARLLRAGRRFPSELGEGVTRFPTQRHEGASRSS